MITTESILRDLKAGLLIGYLSTPEHLRMYDMALKQLNGEGGALVEHGAPEAPAKPNPPIDLSKVMTSIRKKTDKEWWLKPRDFEQATEVLRQLISDTTLHDINAFLAENNTRQIDHRDLAFIWLAHKHNVMKNSDGSSPIKGIVGLGKSARKAGLLSNVPVYLHCSVAIEYFVALGLCQKTAEHAVGVGGNKGQAARYTITPNKWGL